jgi:hypothetical protein
MTPAGYIAQRVVKRPDWIKAPQVEDVYSVSGCVSNNFADSIKHWKHKGYWLFDSVHTIQSLAKDQSIALNDCKFFSYEAFEEEFNDETEKWQSFGPDDGFKTSVAVPARKRLEGYDVVTYSVHTSPECSPLSCNNLAATIETNRRCLLGSFEEASARIQGHDCDDSEPGPFRILAVYILDEA